MTADELVRLLESGLVSNVGQGSLESSVIIFPSEDTDPLASVREGITRCQTGRAEA